MALPPPKSTPTLAELAADGLRALAMRAPAANRFGGKYVPVDAGREGGGALVFALVAPPSFVHSPFAPGRFQDIAIELTPALDEQLEALLEPVHAHVHAHRVALFGAAAADKSRAQIVAERFSASVRRDGAGPPKLRVALLETRPPTIETRTLVDGTSWTPARPGSVDDLVPGAAVLPVVALQGGVWVVNGKFGFKWRLVACTVLTNKRRAARAAPISGEGAMVEVEVEVADPPTTPSASA